MCDVVAVYTRAVWDHKPRYGAGVATVTATAAEDRLKRASKERIRALLMPSCHLGPHVDCGVYVRSAADRRLGPFRRRSPRPAGFR